MNLSLDDSMVNEYKEELDGTIEDIDDSIANKELDELVANDSPVPASGVLADSITFDQLVLHYLLFTIYYYESICETTERDGNKDRMKQRLVQQ